MLRLITLSVTLCLAAVAARADLKTSIGTLQTDLVARGLDQPWGLAFLPGNAFLVTERGGSIWYFDGRGGKSRVAGVPPVAARGQGGLLDIAAARDFAVTRDIFFTFSKPQRGGAGTALARAKMSGDNARLTDVRVIFEMTPGSSGGRHFGSRVVEARDGSLYITIGDRGYRPGAQDLSTHNGTVVRIMRDGSPAADAPFRFVPGVAPGIWSYGHRNPQGAALDGRGQLWVVEHGARGGDEINLIKRGANYGWPVISYGRHYSGLRIGEGTAKQGMAQPNHYWDPSIAPSGMMIYQGDMFPEWKGNIFVGSLKFSHVERLDVRGPRVTPAEVIKGDETGRVRDVREAPDGSIWIMSVRQGAIYRMSR
ncbi:MAG: PQQ-dependent sugar dehydrogenase [Rhodobacteraceae bacterium]|nr:PQQ-dependent sugar dehydrogenase [Paracoccaceae bacterium]